MERYHYTDIYLEQALVTLEGMGMSPEGIANVRKVMREKMYWSYDAGEQDGKLAGVDAAEEAMNVSLDELRETI